MRRRLTILAVPVTLVAVVHSQKFPGGEIRGQITVGGGRWGHDGDD